MNLFGPRSRFVAQAIGGVLRMRVKTSVAKRARHKKVLKEAKGYFGASHRVYRKAHEAVLKAGEDAFAGRKQRKRDMRSLWITRITLQPGTTA